MLESRRLLSGTPMGPDDLPDATAAEVEILAAPRPDDPGGETDLVFLLPPEELDSRAPVESQPEDAGRSVTTLMVGPLELEEFAPTPAPLSSPGSWTVTQVILDFTSPEQMFFDAGTLISEEGEAPHSTPESAIRLPGEHSTTIFGTILDGEGPDVYVVYPQVGAYRLRLTSLHDASTLADRLVITDAQGRVIAGLNVTRTANTLTIDIQTDSPQSSETLYVTVGPHPHEHEHHNGPDSYALQVLPIGPDSPVNHPGDPKAPPGPGGASTPPGPTRGQLETTVSVPVILPIPVAAPGAHPRGASVVTPSQDDAEVEAETPPHGSEIAVAGPLPALAAAPLAGILASGEKTLEVDAHEAAVIDLALLDLSATAEDQAGEDELPPVARSSGEVLPALVALDGPGHLPRLEAALMLSPAEAQPEILLADTPAGPVAEGPAQAEPGEPLTPARRFRRAVVAGLSALMAAHLLLPDAGLALPFVRHPSRTRRTARSFAPGVPTGPLRSFKS